ncbi:hypothetical protein G9A89_001965 [Geosiphon pyriformis]|nr:hypothetical protein G9A89_001965 [Geosiphon pyriformis]
MAIELAQRIEDNQRMHLESTLPVFAPVLVMAPAPQMAATSFAAQTQDLNEQLINRLTANLAQLLESLAQAVRDNQQLQRPRFENCFNQPQQSPYQRQQNCGPLVCYRYTPPKSENASQPEENPFYTFNITNDDHNMDELAINISESTRKKKKAKVDFVLDPNKPSTSTADNNEPPKTKVFKNLLNNVTPLICKVQVAGYFIDLILDSGSSVSVIAKHFLEAIEAKKYTIIVGNKWLKKAKALLDYELCELTIKCGEKPIIVKCSHWTTPPVNKQNQEKKQLDELDDEESNKEKEQEEQKETAELIYTTFTNNGKPLDNVKADKEGIIVNGKLICWPYYDILRKTFDQKPDKKANTSATNSCILQVMNTNHKDTSTIGTIESLSIIQKTSSKPSDTTLAESHPWKTSTNKHHPKVAESENIGANHLGFAKSLFQYYCQYLGLNHNHISAESAFNFYINEKISSLLGTPVNTESAKETFYRELIQNTNLPTNHNFTSIITEINKEIEHYTQQRYPITYVNKGKRKLQTPAVTSRKIQPSTWKKNRIEFPSNPSYHYTPGSAINILSTDAFLSTATSVFGQFPFQSRQRKTELLGPYGEYFERFNSRSSIPLGLQSPPPPPDFRISNLWEAAESEKEEEESEDQEFTYQHPIIENPEQNLNLKNLEIETPNHQRQNNPNSELINQQNLSLVIVIDQLLINPIAKPIQQPLQLPSQQPVQQQLLQQPPQPPNLDPMAYAPITKLDNFTGEEDDAQAWLNDVEKAITANGWNDIQAMQAIPYFLKNTANSCNNNSINHLEKLKWSPLTWDTFIKTCTKFKQLMPTISQPHRYSTSLSMACAAASYNMYIYTVTCTRDFESAESEANHAQAVNLVMNESSELDSKLENLHNDAIIKETLIMPKINHVYLHRPINSGNRKRVSATIVVNKDISKLTVYPNQNQSAYLPVIQSSPQVIYQQPQPQIIYQPQQIQTPPQSLPLNETQRPKMTQQSCSSQQSSGLCQQNLGAGQPQNPNFQNYLSLLVTPEDASTNNPAFAQKQLLTSNIPPVTITEDESLATIFPFKFKETTAMLLFSGAALEAKPITIMYTDVKVEGQFIKLILDSVDQAASARIITTDEATKTPIGEIDNFPFEVNGIMTLIKVLVMEVTQYQALVATCGHFKTPPREKLLIKLEEKKEKPTWKAYQVFWADADHNKLLLIFSWNDNPKEKQKEELTWETDNLI